MLSVFVDVFMLSCLRHTAKHTQHFQRLKRNGPEVSVLHHGTGSLHSLAWPSVCSQPGHLPTSAVSVYIQGWKTLELAGALWLATNGRGHFRMRVIFLLGRRDFSFRVDECSGADGVYCLLGKGNREESEGMECKDAAAGTSFPEFQSRPSSPSAERQSSFQSWLGRIGSCSASSVSLQLLQVRPKLRNHCVLLYN